MPDVQELKAKAEETLEKAWNVADRAFDTGSKRAIGLGLAAIAAVGAAFGTKAHHEKLRREQYAVEQQKYEAERREQQGVSAEKKQTKIEMIQKLGANNKVSGNFRAMVRNGGTALEGPNNMAPDPGAGEVEIVQQNQM